MSFLVLKFFRNTDKRGISGIIRYFLMTVGEGKAKPRVIQSKGEVLGVFRRKGGTQIDILGTQKLLIAYNQIFFASVYARIYRRAYAYAVIIHKLPSVVSEYCIGYNNWYKSIFKKLKVYPVEPSIRGVQGGVRC